MSSTLIIHLANKLYILYSKIIIIKLRKKIEKKNAYHINNKYAYECFLFIYFYLVNFYVKIQKSEEKRKIPRSRRYMTIFPLFFFLFSPIFLLLLHFSITIESGLRLRKTRKGGWKGGTCQNSVVLAFFFYIKKMLQNDVILACSFKIKKGQNEAVSDLKNKIK